MDGWTTRRWTRAELPMIETWYLAMREAGMGDWGTGPAADEISPLGMLAELDGRPVACVFIYMPPSAAYAAIFSAVCDVTRPAHACFRGLIHAATAARDHCLGLGCREVVCYVRTPAVVKAFEVAGFADAGLDVSHTYICEGVYRWLEP